MNEYKLVPVKPTPEMVSKGARLLQIMSLPEREAASVFRAMLAAAPDIQREPVGYVSPRLLDTLRSGKACGITMEDKPDEHNGVTIPLYTAPQPSEQQLDLHLFAKRMDEELEKHDIQGFEPVVLAVAEEVLGYEQQPAPDDTRLDTDELHKLLMILRSTIGGAMWTLDDEEEELAVRTEKAIEALAVYHKGTKS